MSSGERVAEALAGRQVLVVLDNCEHLIEAAAHMAEALLRASPGVCVIATSREPLRAASGVRLPRAVARRPGRRHRGRGRRAALRRGQALRGARPGGRATVRARPAGTRRRWRRSAAISTGSRLRSSSRPRGSRHSAVEGVASRLDDRFRLLTGGSRTALPRQQTLRATLDWSHDLLADSERVLLRRLSVLAGSFSLHAATSIAAGPELADGDVVEGVANLVAKSLIAVDSSGAVTWYRLLETTRAYAGREARRER